MAGRDEQNNEFFFIVILCLFIALAVFLYLNFEYIAALWRWLRISQTYLFSLFPEDIPLVGSIVKNLKDAHDFLWEANAQEIGPETVQLIDSFISRYLHIITGLLLIIFGLKKQSKNSEQGKSYDMESILDRQAEFYPQVKSFVDVHPEKMDLRFVRGDKSAGKYAASIDPSEFALMVPPLGLESEAENDSLLRKPMWDGEDDLNEEVARRAFEVQLGNRYHGLESLNDYELKLYNLFKDKVVYNRDDIYKTIKSYLTYIIDPDMRKPRDLLVAEAKLYSWLSKYAAGNTSKKGWLRKKSQQFDQLSLLDELTLDKLSTKKELYPIFTDICSERIMARHAYIRPGLMSLMEEARKSGVVPAENFRWLKAFDRTLWYSISTLGRKVAFVECSGVLAHWLVEKQVRAPIPVPEVNEAVKALKKALLIEQDEGTR